MHRRLKAGGCPIHKGGSSTCRQLDKLSCIRQSADTRKTLQSIWNVAAEAWEPYDLEVCTLWASGQTRVQSMLFCKIRCTTAQVHRSGRGAEVQRSDGILYAVSVELAAKDHLSRWQLSWALCHAHLNSCRQRSMSVSFCSASPTSSFLSRRNHFCVSSSPCP